MTDHESFLNAIRAQLVKVVWDKLPTDKRNHIMWKWFSTSEAAIAALGESVYAALKALVDEDAALAGGES